MRVFTALLVASACIPVPLSGQDGCVAAEGTELFVSESIPGGGQISYFARPHLVCDGGVEIWADSAVDNSRLGMSHLMGSVRYVDATRVLTADTARFFNDQGRLQATGNVTIVDESDGSRIENGDLVYLQQTAFREVETLTVTIGPDGLRPRAVMAPSQPDSVAADEPPPPYTVVGDRIVLVGTVFTSVGTVEIERDSLFAFADSVEYQEATDGLLLDGNARVVTGTNDLVGQTITMGSPGGERSEIWARREAMLTGDDLLLTSPQILVVLADGELERLVATPMLGDGSSIPDSVDLVKPIATVEDFELTADSLEVTAPNDVVERVFASGSARSVSTSRDSLNVELLPEVARTDWLEGDTVIVSFIPVVPEPGAEEDPTASEYEVESIVAKGNASSLYRLVPSDSTAKVGVDPPAVHYVVGDQITIRMVDGDVDGMEVIGQTRGVHLEPLARPAAPDTSAAATDTLSYSTRRPGSGSARPRPSPPHRAIPSSESAMSPEEAPWRRK